jgi:protein-S-isoprenylcysteine O-methyltransferase Ste14
MKLCILVGSGRSIGLFTAPFLLIGLVLNILFPDAFAVGGPPRTLALISILVLLPGVVNWGWCVFLILTKIPRGELITSGPYAFVLHPLYTGVAILVLPWAGFLCNTWLGAAVGLVVYAGSRIYAVTEEEQLAKIFGAEWEVYRRSVKLPWL